MTHEERRTLAALVLFWADGSVMGEWSSLDSKIRHGFLFDADEALAAIDEMSPGKGAA